MSSFLAWQSIPSPFEGIVRLSVAKIVAYFSSPVARFFGGRKKKFAIQLAGRPRGVPPSSGWPAREECRRQGKGPVRSTSLSRAISLPPAGERPCAKHFPFTGHAPGRALFCEAPGHVRGIGLPVGRARGAPCKTAAHPAIGKAIAPPWAAEPWRKRRGHWRSVKPSGKAIGEA